MKTTRLRTEVTAALVFWGLVFFMYAAQTWWLLTFERVPPGTRLAPALVWSGGFYLWWAPLSVFVWNITRDWLPARVGWPGFVGRHLALGVAAAVVHVLLIIASARVLLPPDPEPVWTAFVSQLRSRSYVELIIYAGVVASGMAAVYYTQWRDRELDAARLEAQLASSRLDTLQQQLQPHFLFNSLHAVASLAREGRHADVVRMIANLSDLLRAVTDQTGPTQTLGTEIGLARRYLDIQHVRFGDRLTFEIDAPADLADCVVPTLTLQPLVDNAVRHGIATQVHGGSVRVGASVQGGALMLVVEDTGVGAPEGFALAAAHGTGLRNLDARLRIMYPGRATLTAGPAAPGFRVVVTLPVQRA